MGVFIQTYDQEIGSLSSFYVKGDRYSLPLLKQLIGQDFVSPCIRNFKKCVGLSLFVA